MPRYPVFIGREKEISEILGEMKKGKNILLTGDTGIGKSALLIKLYSVISGKKIYIHTLKTRDQLTEILRGITENGDITWEDMWMEKKDEPISWKSIRTRVTRMKIRELTEIILPILRVKAVRNRYHLFLDDITTISPTQIAVLLALFEVCQVSACASEKKPSLKKIYWKMKEYHIRGLSIQDQEKIITHYITEKNILVQHPQFFRKMIRTKSGGNPQAIMDILTESALEKTVSKKHIRDITHDAPTKYIDMTPFALIVGVILVCMRYLGYGVHNPEMYIIGGIGMGFFIFFRFFLYRGMKKEKE